MRFDKHAGWYHGYEEELLRFTGFGEAILDDQFDSTAILVRGLGELPIIESDEDVLSADELEEAMTMRRQAKDARSVRRSATGY